MKVIAVIQARMGSTRLPGKSLMKISKYTLLETVINSIKRNQFIDEIVVATTNLPEDNAIEELCLEKELKYYRGDSTDVLSRFLTIAKNYSEKDIIVRVTADNPINNHKVSELLFKHHVVNGNDYSCLKGLSHTVYEFINVKSLLELEYENNLDVDEKEHVTMYFRRSNRFKISQLPPSEYGIDPKKDKMLTIDSKQDFKRFMMLKQEIDLDSSIDFDVLDTLLK